MPVLLHVEHCLGYTRFIPVKTVDDEILHKAKEIFNAYRQRGVIQTFSFQENTWVLSDEVRTIRIVFDIAGEDFFQPWLGCTAECYLNCMKAYLLLQFGQFTITTIRLIAQDLNRLASCTADEACTGWKSGGHIPKFLSWIPGSNMYREEVIEWLEMNGNFPRKAGMPRKLAEFRYYLEFHEYMRVFWKTVQKAEKREFFPIYLWWNLTAILPLRATEFLLLPYDCVHYVEGEALLTVRRTRLKKKNSPVMYTIENDYVKNTYGIPPSLAEEILWYRKVTADCRRKYDLLFEVPAGSGYSSFTYQQAKSLLERFCREVIGDEKYPIHLGDTRHLAMINLILSGGSPVICRELAGHDGIDISSHYYANLSSIVESTVYDRVCCQRSSGILKGTFRFSGDIPCGGIRVKKGWCDVSAVGEGDISECLKHITADGRIGECEECPHFIAEQPDMRLAVIQKKKETVDADTEFLIRMIEQVRKGMGHTEDIRSALLRLQNSAYAYGKVLARNCREE